LIFVVAGAEDDHAPSVIEALRRRGAACRLLDLARFPEALPLSARIGSDGRVEARLGSATDDAFDLTDVGAVWWRRPQPYGISDDLVRPSHRSFAWQECHEALSGVWSSLDAFWVNDPALDEAAGRKVYQLGLARAVGLSTPDTLVTSDVDEARDFVGRHGPGRTVYKAFTGTEVAWRETRLLRDDEVGLLDHVRYAPVIFQEYIEGGADYRVTVVGPHVHAAEIVPHPGGYTADYRMEWRSAAVTATTLPGDIVEGLHALMKGLGLVYGAVDLRRRGDGELVFLEVNPAGQWLFVEGRTGLPITDSLADVLLEGSTR